MKKLTATLMATFMVLTLCACTREETDHVSSIQSEPPASADVSSIISSTISESSSSEDVSSDEYIDKSRPTSSEISSEPPFTAADEVLSNVSTEKAGRGADIVLNEALSLYRATVNDGRICVWKKTENKEKQGVDVELLMYDEADERLEYVITYTVENRKFTPFSIKDDGFLYQYGGNADSKRDVFEDIDTDDLIDLTGDTPVVTLQADYYPTATEDKTIDEVEHGEGLSIKDGVYELYSSHPEYGELASAAVCGNYAVMVFETDEHFTESTSTMVLYDYSKKTEKVFDAMEGEDCGYTMYDFVDIQFADEEHLIVHNGGEGTTYVYETLTGKKTVIENVNADEHYGDGVTKMSLECYNGYVLWHQRNEGLFSMSLDDYSVKLLAEELYLFEIVNDKLLVKTGGLDYTIDAGDLYVSDGDTLTLIGSDVYCYFFADDTVWYQVGDVEGNYEWFSKAW